MAKTAGEALPKIIFFQCFNTSDYPNHYLEVILSSFPCFLTTRFVRYSRPRRQRFTIRRHSYVNNLQVFNPFLISPSVRLPL